MTTKRGELSIRVDECALLAKALRPPAGGHHGLADVETRYRQRYADLEVNERTREIFRIRHAAVHAIRNHLAEKGFTEVEGPVLQSIQGGASARPFVTHHNALDLDMYLRIALELHLKRLIVGGMERVFELGRVFRNEGVDTRHNPEFTMLEAYQAFADYHDMMDLTEGMVVAAAHAALGDELTVRYQGREIDLRPPWPRQRFADMIAEKTGEVMHPDMPIADARAALDRLGIAWEQGWGPGRLMKEVYDERVQHDVVGPVFCIDYPREVSPLARAHRDDPAYSERFELIVAGFELCNAYSEQNDPVVQMAAFEEEAQAKRDGDPEAGDIDLDYVRALEYGMPPTGGLGIGIDRLVMLLASVDSIREVILFPTLRPEFAPPPGGGPGGAHRPVLPPTPMPAAALAAATPPAPMAVATAGAAVASDEGPPSRPWVVTVIAGLTALAGLLHLLVHVPIVHERLGDRINVDLVPPWFAVTGHVLSAAIGLLLLLLADQLAKRKQAAWRVAVGLSALALVAHILKGPHQVGLGISVALLVLLIVARKNFRAPADPPSLLRLVRFVPIYLAAVLAFGFVSLGLQSGRMTPDLTFLGGLETIFGGLVGIDGPYTFDRRLFAETFPAALLALGVVGLVVFLILLFRPLTARDPHTRDDWSRARLLVQTYGWDTLAAFALRDDKSFFFGSDGRAMIAYTYLGGYALAAGDPIGDEASLPAVVDEFLAMCAQRAWTPAFLAAREEDTAERRPARLAGLPVVLPGRRGDHRLPVVHPRGPRAQERARGRAAGGAHVPVPDDRRVGGVAEARRGAQRDLGEVARQGPRARLHDVALAGHHRVRRQPRLPALRRPRRRRRARRLPAARACLRRTGHRHDVRLHARPHAPRPRRPERDDGVPHREERRGARRAWCHAAVDELRDVGPAVRRRRAVHRHAEAGPARGGRAQPVLPGPLAARLQREVRAAVAAAGARVPQPRRPAPGRPALRGRRGLPRPPGARPAVRAGRRGRGAVAVEHPRGPLGAPGCGGGMKRSGTAAGRTAA